MNRAPLALLALVALAVPAAAGDHLVTPQAAEQQLLAAASARERDRGTVAAFVASPDGAAALGTLGVDPAAVRAALSTLSDAEVREIASRAAALQADPVAGAVSREVIWIGAIALAAIILIILVA